ncbi:hypothetical protein [Pseudoduganella flava]|nr:hypothetical protein [Pseudoduganella flava]QGZ39344.1 hypothetical protein GO485_09990 [Pseudoduganella flava]
MDECSCPDNGCYGYAQPFDTFSIPDHYAESYNYTTTDPIAIMLRQQREDDERRIFDAAQLMFDTERAPDERLIFNAAPALFQAEPTPVRLHEASYRSEYITSPNCESMSGQAFCKAAAAYALLCADDEDAPHEALAAAAAGHKYYYLPGEPISWRRPLRSPGGEYDAQWWKMFHHADERSMVLAELLGYTGKRDTDGWIRPTWLELLKMGFWTAHRYAFYYAEFAEEFGRKVPRWIALLPSRQTYTPSAVMFG